MPTSTRQFHPEWGLIRNKRQNGPQFDSCSLCVHRYYTYAIKWIIDCKEGNRKRLTVHRQLKKGEHSWSKRAENQLHLNAQWFGPQGGDPGIAARGGDPPSESSSHPLSFVPPQCIPTCLKTHSKSPENQTSTLTSRIWQQGVLKSSTCVLTSKYLEVRSPGRSRLHRKHEEFNEQFLPDSWILLDRYDQPFEFLILRNYRSNSFSNHFPFSWQAFEHLPVGPWISMTCIVYDRAKTETINSLNRSLAHLQWLDPLRDVEQQDIFDLREILWGNSVSIFLSRTHPGNEAASERRPHEHGNFSNKWGARINEEKETTPQPLNGRIIISPLLHIFGPLGTMNRNQRLCWYRSREDLSHPKSGDRY
jgi:hypothetical protein